MHHDLAERRQSERQLIFPESSYRSSFESSIHSDFDDLIRMCIFQKHYDTTVHDAKRPGDGQANDIKGGIVPATLIEINSPVYGCNNQVKPDTHWRRWL
jgi:hypothetical protein